jgi:mRNA interferase MazF
MNRGEVWWVQFDPSIGSEIRKDRPAIIVSNDASNRHTSRLQVIPITSKMGRLFPSEALVSINGEARKAVADQITTVSKLRVGTRIGRISATDLEQVERVIRVQLGLT